MKFFKQKHHLYRLSPPTTPARRRPRRAYCPPTRYPQPANPPPAARQPATRNPPTRYPQPANPPPAARQPATRNPPTRHPQPANPPPATRQPATRNPQTHHPPKHTPKSTHKRSRRRSALLGFAFALLLACRFARCARRSPLLGFAFAQVRACACASPRVRSPLAANTVSCANAAISGGFRGSLPAPHPPPVRAGGSPPASSWSPRVACGRLVPARGRLVVASCFYRPAQRFGGRRRPKARPLAPCC